MKCIVVGSSEPSCLGFGVELVMASWVMVVLLAVLLVWVGCPVPEVRSSLSSIFLHSSPFG